MRANYYSFICQSVQIIHRMDAFFRKPSDHLWVMNDGAVGNGFNARICRIFRDFHGSFHAVAKAHHFRFIDFHDFDSQLKRPL